MQDYNDLKSIQEAYVGMNLDKDNHAVNESVRAKIGDTISNFVDVDLVAQALKGFDRKMDEIIKQIPNDQKNNVKSKIKDFRSKLTRAKSLSEFEKIAQREMKKMADELKSAGIM